MFQVDKIKNIIFDLGGVLLNLDYDKTEKEFEKLGVKDFNSIYNQFGQSNLFDDYETGKISSQKFRDSLKMHLPNNVTDQQINAAWNAMLLELPNERIKLLFELKIHFNIYLYSNTNEIHIKHFRSYLDDKFGTGLFDSIFINHYYSNEFGMRKPNPKAFTKLIEIEGLNPVETFFVDDSPQHVKGAKDAGLNAYHLKVKEGETVLDLFKDFVI